MKLLDYKYIKSTVRVLELLNNEMSHNWSEFSFNDTNRLVYELIIHQ